MTHQELVAKMLLAYREDEVGKSDPTKRMSAALKSAGEELLSEATIEESEKFQEDYMAVDLDTAVADRRHALTELLGRRLAKLNPKPPTLADRIKPILDKWYNQPCDTQSLAEEVVRELERKS